MNVQRIAAFSSNGEGGNPAGVALLQTAISESHMQSIAAEVGYSETVFAVPIEDVEKSWRVRYFSPEAEVAFCGHATIALGAVLGEQDGPGTYNLKLNDAAITVTAQASKNGMALTLTSPETRSTMATDEEINDAMALFGLQQDDLDDRLPPARIHGGVDHIMIALAHRSRLAEMDYDLDAGRNVMHQHGFGTIMLVFIESDNIFAVRNAFAVGGVLEDPATGGAAAAFAGYLRDQGWPHGGCFTIRQGEDMGMPSIIEVQLSDEPGSSVQISGSTHLISSF